MRRSCRKDLILDDAFEAANGDELHGLAVIPQVGAAGVVTERGAE
jgi:hypothetical protein